MTTIGNLILCLAALFYFGLLFTLFKKPNGADAAIGYAWLAVIFNLALLVCLTFASAMISRKGGFAWISPSRSVRLMLVTGGLLAAICTTTLCAVFTNEKARMPALLRFLVTVVPIVIPLVLLPAATILLNNSLRASVPPIVYKWPLAAVFIIGFAGIGVTVYTYNLERRNEEKSRKEKRRIKTSNNAEVLNSSVDQS